MRGEDNVPLQVISKSKNKMTEGFDNPIAHMRLVWGGSSMNPSGEHFNIRM